MLSKQPYPHVKCGTNFTTLKTVWFSRASMVPSLPPSGGFHWQVQHNALYLIPFSPLSASWRVLSQDNGGCNGYFVSLTSLLLTWLDGLLQHNNMVWDAQRGPAAPLVLIVINASKLSFFTGVIIIGVGWEKSERWDSVLQCPLAGQFRGKKTC